LNILEIRGNQITYSLQYEFISTFLPLRHPQVHGYMTLLQV